MKEKSIFDKIYHKELDLNFNNLKNIKSVEDKNSESLNDKVDLKEASNESLDAFVTLLYNNKNTSKVKIPSAFEKQVLEEKVLRNRVKAQKIRDEIEELKFRIKERVQNKSYVLNISNSTPLKKAANNIFGGNKTKITYNDYTALLELKEQIIINESMDMMED